MPSTPVVIFNLVSFKTRRNIRRTVFRSDGYQRRRTHTPVPDPSRKSYDSKIRAATYLLFPQGGHYNRRSFRFGDFEVARHDRRKLSLITPGKWYRREIRVCLYRRRSAEPNPLGQDDPWHYNPATFWSNSPSPNPTSLAPLPPPAIFPGWQLRVS